MKRVCFTGRRPKDLCGYSWSRYEQFQHKFLNYLISLYKKGAREFVTGGAQGFDQMSFWAVNALKSIYPDVKNIVYVPHKGQPDAWKGKVSDAFSKAEYERMLSLADEVIYLVDNYIQDYRQVCKALIDRNHRMVDDSDLIVALYPNDNWQLPETKGGTAECMKYAKRKRKPIAQINYTIDNYTLQFGTVVEHAA